MAIGGVGRMGIFRFATGEDLIEGIKKRAKDNNIECGAFFLIGALKNAIVSLYQNEKYTNTSLAGPLEIASCLGNVALGEEGETVVHAHIVVTNYKGEAFGGHLMPDSFVGPTAELVMFEGADMRLQRTLDDSTKLRLLKLG